MKECQAHNTWFQNYCFKCTNAERSQIRAEQDHCQQPKNELAQGKEKFESFLSRVFQRKKDKKRDHESQSRSSSKISKRRQPFTLIVKADADGWKL
jgi:nuclear transport factor 2 (NTF2) superfamily protein